MRYQRGALERPRNWLGFSPADMRELPSEICLNIPPGLVVRVRRMRLAISLAVFLGLIVSFPWPQVMASPETAEVPTYDIGDFWTYDYNVNFGGLSLDGTYHYSVEQKPLVNGAPSYYLSINGSGSIVGMAGGSFTLAGATRLRASDLAAWNQTTRVSVTVAGLVTVVEAKTTYSQAYETYAFPLQVGKTWSATTQSTTTTTVTVNGNPSPEETQTITTTVDYKVEKIRSVTVTAGTFDVFEIRAETEGGNSSMERFAPLAGIPAVFENFNSQDVRILKLELTDYDFTPRRSIQGRIVSPSGEGIRGTTVKIYSGDVLISSTDTNVTGGFLFQNLTALSYRLVASHPDYEETLVNLTIPENIMLFDAGSTKLKSPTVVDGPNIWPWVLIILLAGGVLVVSILLLLRRGKKGGVTAPKEPPTSPPPANPPSQ